MVRHGNAAPASPSWVARAVAIGRVEWRQRSASAAASGAMGQHRQHVGLGVPEGVPVVAGAGQSLGGDRAALRAGAGLQHVEQREPNGLLDLGIPVELDVGASPEVVKVAALCDEQAVPAGVSCAGQGSVGLIAHRGQGAGCATIRRRQTCPGEAAWPGSSSP